MAAARGRPRGTGYPEQATLGQVYGLLMSGDARSRRAAILTLVGDHPSDVRRIERKLNGLFGSITMKTIFENGVDVDAYFDSIPREDAIRACGRVDLAEVSDGDARFWRGRAVALMNAIYLARADIGPGAPAASRCLSYGFLVGLARPELAEAGGPALSGRGRSELLAFLRHLPGFDDRPFGDAARDQFGYLSMQFAPLPPARVA